MTHEILDLVEGERYRLSGVFLAESPSVPLVEGECFPREQLVIARRQVYLERLLAPNVDSLPYHRFTSSPG